MRVALYERVSTEEQSLHGLSIEAQKAALEEWAKGKTVVGHYTDLGVSARKPILKRPELQRLLRDVQAGKIDVVAFTRLDRWTRNVREYYKAQDVLDAHNVAWAAISENYETISSEGKFLVHVMLAVAQQEADRTSDRVKAVFADKRRRGLAVNGHVPPGIDYQEGQLIPNNDAEKVRALFAHYAAHRSLHLTAYEAKDILGRQYSQRGIKQLMLNEKYLVAGVVSPEEWETVHTIMKSRETRSVRTDRVYLFSGILKCPCCGMKLTVRTRLWNGVEYIYYRCDRHDKGQRCAFNKGIREHELESYLLRQILPAVVGYNMEIAKKREKPVDVVKLQKKLDRINELYIEGDVSKEEYASRSAPIRDAIRSAQIEPREIDESEIMSAVDVYPSLSKQAQKAFWSVLLKEITPTDNGFSFALF